MIQRIGYYNVYCDCPCVGTCFRALGEDGVDVVSLSNRSEAGRTALAMGWKRKGKRWFCSECSKNCEEKKR